MAAQMRKQISTLETSQQELFLKNEKTMEELRKENNALKKENEALKRAKESFLEDIFHLTMSNKVLAENQGNGGGSGDSTRLKERNQHLKEEIEAKGVLLSQQFEVNFRLSELLSKSVNIAREQNAPQELIQFLTLNANAATEAGHSMEALEAELGRKKNANRSWSEAARASITNLKGLWG